MAQPSVMPIYESPMENKETIGQETKRAIRSALEEVEKAQKDLDLKIQKVKNAMLSGTFGKA